MERLRFLLSADPSRLAVFDREAALEQAQSRLRQTRNDVELTHVEQLAPNMIGVVLLVEPTVCFDEIDGIATDLRAAFDIGPGTHEFGGSAVEGVRGISVETIGGTSEECRLCGLGGGRHLAGCPQADR